MAAGGDKRVVLYVEDDRLNAELVAEIVAMIDRAQLEVAPSLAAARRVLATHTVDAVLVDLDLPDGAGLDLIDDLAGLDRRPPLLVVTGDASAAARSAAFAAGAEGVVVKPYRVGELLAALETAIRPRPDHV